MFFKFTDAPESVYIFETLGMEPWGSIGSGVAELIAVLLLLIPATAAVGSVLALGVISGAEFEGGFELNSVQRKPSANGALVILYSNDLEASVEAVTAAGGTISVPPFGFPGGRRFHFRDPSGNELAIWTPA